jgi:uncharacterized protein (TIGR03032 family)
VTDKQPAFELTTSRGFNTWLASTGGSLAFSTYQGNKIFFIGLKPDSSLSVFERSFPRAMGIGLSQDARSILLATQVQIYRFDNALPSGEKQGDFDAVFLPNQSWITGDLDIHDIGFGADGGPLFASTLFNCIGTVVEGYNFRPAWKPDFIDHFVPEDRCHLNGMALQSGQARYVTCVSRSNAADGWRDRRHDGGVVVDVTTGDVVAKGLSMPHSPRLRDGKLWIVNSGRGDLGVIDPATGHFEPVAFCPGYARGLAFAGEFAVVGLSRARKNRTFDGLDLQTALNERDVEARCGLSIVNTTTGAATDWIRIDGIIDELYDVAFLPGIRAASAVGIVGPEIQRTISVKQ